MPRKKKKNVNYAFSGKEEMSKLEENDKYGIDHLSESCKTISHEILTSITNRVERKFV